MFLNEAEAQKEAEESPHSPWTEIGQGLSKGLLRIHFRELRSLTVTTTTTASPATVPSSRLASVGLCSWDLRPLIDTLYLGEWDMHIKFLKKNQGNI